jgi:hypothetical protein
MRFALVVVHLLVALIHVSASVRAQLPVLFRMLSDGVWLRAEPSALAPTGQVAVNGRVYDVIARTEDNTWLALRSGDVSGWVPAGFGAIAGDLSSVGAYRRPEFKLVRNQSTAALPPWQRVTPRGRQLFQAAVKAGRDPRVFTIAGDSNSAWPRHLGRLVHRGLGATRFAAYSYALRRFDPSFARVSVAIGGGYRAADMFLPERAHPSCLPGETLFPCELRQSRASVVFIQLGTGDKFAWREFEANLRALVDYALAQNALPVLMTKADDLESVQGGASDNHINEVIRRLAAEYQVPLIDWHAASRSQPVIPNPELPKRPFIKNGLHDEWGYYFHLTDEAFELRVLSNLQIMDALTR